ncbi:MAG: UDP-N-acetylmuramoyl-L-alanine--D-glutamate ligase [Bacteroidota bacterium]
MKNTNITDKKITVLGAVRSGLGAAKLIKQMGGIPFVSDAAGEEKLAASLDVLKNEGIEYECGGHTDRIYDCDFIITSPGVPSNSTVMLNASERNIPVISEVEFASWFCKGKIVSITGTNGKTTTTSLCTHVLNHCGINTFSAGNIGLAFSEVVSEVGENDVVALETSSFQLDHIDSFRPDIAAILNITPDHLDRYNNHLEEYVAAKYRIFENQTSEDKLILNADDKYLPGEVTVKSSKYAFSLSMPQSNGAWLEDKHLHLALGGKEIYSVPVSSVSLKGEHNYANIMVVMIISAILECDKDKVTEALGTFPGVEHRLEFVRELDGVIYINDSKATNVDSVWYALRSFDEPIFLILGGKDKGNDYDQIRDLVVDRVKKIYAIGSSAEKVFNYFHKLVKVEVKNTLEDCIIAANSEARENEIVLLSPACASFDMFDSYEHRGKVFKEAVNRL